MDLKKWINEVLQEVIMEDFEYHYDRNSFTPNFMVAHTAQNALQVIEKNNLVQSTGENEGSGIEKAKQLSTQTPINHSQLKRMKAFFDNNHSEYQTEKMSGKNINNSPIIQKWELWGGDAGRQWVEQQIKSVQQTNRQSKKIRPKTKNLMNPHNTRTKGVNLFYKPGQ